MIAATEQLMPVQNIRDDVVITKNGTISIVLQTSSINFGLLSENEQLAIISAFAGFLNSLSFVIQIVIHSRKLDISEYITHLDEAQKKQTNPLLSTMMNHYRNFIRETIRENEVLDKQFYVVVSVSYLETGISKNIEDNFDKALTILIPRRDHVLRQMARMGLKAVQLNTNELISLFYDIYNEAPPSPSDNFLPANPSIQPETPIAATNKPEPATDNILDKPLVLPTEIQQPEASPAKNSATVANPETTTPSQPTASSQSTPASGTVPTQPRQWRNLPFVVEELGDDYGTI